MDSKLLSPFPVFAIAFKILGRGFIHYRHSLLCLITNKELGKRGGIDLTDFIKTY